MAYMTSKTIQADIATLRGVPTQGSTIGNRIAQGALGVGLTAFGLHYLLENALPGLEEEVPVEEESPVEGEPDDTLDPDDFGTPPPPRDDEPEPEPLNVVLPVDGLNMRSDASAQADRLGVLLHGTFVQPTGARKYDENGNEWLEVEGQVYGGETMHGWVNASYVAAQIPGEAAQIPGQQGNAGRINPELEAQGYRYVVIGDSDTFWGIASTNDVSFDEIVAFNAHIIDPDQVYAGDRVYLPHTAMPIEQRPR
jgi:Bacterial SH3 domain/LysM domain